MKKAIFVLSLIIFLGSNVYALDNTLRDIRNEIFEESKKIKSSLESSRDIVLTSSMWDSCIMTMTQLDAYFYMLDIFNTIKEEDLDEGPINTLGRWLSEIKKTNELNIKGLNAFPEPIETHTTLYMERLKGHYSDLNNQIDAELKKISVLKDSLEIRKKNAE